MSAVEPQDERKLRDYPPHERNNAKRLSGSALQELARNHGIAASTMDGMTDEKLRKQISHVQGYQSMRDSENALG